MSSFENQIAVVTGGNSGIGLATAQAFAREGARVVIFGRNAETLEEAAASLGEGALAVQGDVSKPADLDRLFATVKERHGRIDALFVNAGVAQVAPFAETDEETFDRMFDINVKGAYFTAQKALPLMPEGASIVFNASVAAQLGMPGMSAYGATKAAVRSLVRTLAAELAERGIRVNSVSPGPIETPIYERMELPAEQMDALSTAILSQVPMGRFGSPAEVAEAVLFLSAPGSSYVQGVDLEVDGGMTQT